MKSDKASENFLHLDAILDQVNAAFLKLARKENLSGSVIERWRWDIPSIYIHWQEMNEIQRNITALVQQENPYQLLAFEVNAWRDTDESECRVRRWRHDDRGKLKLPVEEPQLWNKIFDAYAYVSDWSEEALTNVDKAPLIPYLK